jgi:hypothetical protein
MRSCSSGGARGEEITRNCKDWRLEEELTGEWRTVTTLGRNSSEGGLPVAGGGGPDVRSGGKKCGAREGAGEEWVTEERTAFQARFENDRSTVWQRVKK